MTKLLELARDPNATLRTVPVVLPVALDQSYDYLVGETGAVEPGDFVLVPFGPQVRIGIVWDAPVGEQKPIAREKLKALCRHCRCTAIAGRVDAVCRMDSKVHPVVAGHGGAHDDGRTGGVRAGEAALRRSNRTRRPVAAADD